MGCLMADRWADLLVLPMVEQWVEKTDNKLVVVKADKSGHWRA